MNLSESGQELLEELWVASEEAGQRGVPAVDQLPEGAGELMRFGLAVRVDGRLVLTGSGRPEAEQAVRRHRLAERLVADVLATTEERMDAHACQLEHALFDGLDDSICTLLGHPRFCPHGRPIPHGRCCQERRETVGRLIAPLRDLKPGQVGQIAYLQTRSEDRPQKLMAMGVLPGVTVKLLERFPSFVFEAGFSQFAVDEEIAGDIFVRLGS